MAILNVTANGSTLVKASQGTLMCVLIGVPGSATTLAIYDGTSAAGKLLATINTAPAGAVAMSQLGLTFTNGLFVVAAGTTPANLTLIYQ